MGDPRFILAGLLVGTLVGFSGMGGGSLMTPVLIMLGLPPAKAIGSDLLYSAVTKTLGTVSHARRQNVDWGLARWMATGSIPASLAGVFTVTRIKDALGVDADKLLQQILGATLIIVGCVVVYGLVARTPKVVVGSAPVTMTPRRKALAVLVGLVGGYGVGLTSIGSGTLFAVALIFAFPLAARRVVGTDLFHASLLVWAAGLAHAAAGNVQFGTVGALLIGSLPGVLIGSQLTGRLPERPLRGALAGVLVLSGTLLV